MEFRGELMKIDDSNRRLCSDEDICGIGKIQVIIKTFQNISKIYNLMKSNKIN